MIDRDPKSPNTDPKGYDAELQPDPHPQMSTGERANTAQIILTAVGATAVIVLLLFGLNHQRDETSTASVSAPATTGAACTIPTDAKQQEAQKQDGQKQQGDQKADQAKNQQDAKPGQQGGQANQPSGQAENDKGAGNAS